MVNPRLLTLSTCKIEEFLSAAIVLCAKISNATSIFRARFTEPLMRHINPDRFTTLTLILLTLFATVGPVAIDIFTPSLPSIAAQFQTDSVTAQWSVGLFMMGFAISMLIVGPIADRLGRKKALWLGYTVFLAATVLILTTDNIYLFNAGRFIQAVFGCFGTAVARMMARDYYRDQMEVKMLAYIGGTLTIAPMVAPIVGGYIQEYASWHYSFYVMAAMAVIAMLTLTLLPEKHEVAKKGDGASTSVMASYIAVLTDLRYLRFTVAAGSAFAGAFVFVAGGSFVMIGQLGVTPAMYGYLFAIGIGSYMLSATVGPRLTANLSRAQSTKISGAVLLLGTAIMLGSGLLSNGQSMWGYVVGFALYEMGLGLFTPLCQARATEHMTENTGTAAGLIFFIEMMLATLITSCIAFVPEAGTTSLAMVTVAAVLVAGLCLLPSSNEKSVVV